MTKKNSMKKILGQIELPNGCRAYVRENGVGGLEYTSDEIAGGVLVWDTATVCSSTLMAVLTDFMARCHRAHAKRRKEERLKNG